MQRPTDQPVRYVDITEETRELWADGWIDPRSPQAPRSNKKIPGVKLELYEHQRLVLLPLSVLEAKGSIKCTLPMVKALSRTIGDLFETMGRKTGRLESDAWFINLPVGSGKTLIILSLVALKRVPERRTTILGSDFSHAFLSSVASEIAEFPRQNPSQLALIGDNPWFFTSDEPCYPSITPKIIDRVRVRDEDIIPCSVFLVGPNLIEQMRGYCEQQVEYPWLVLPDLKALCEFLVNACVDPDGTFGKYHLIIIPARSFTRADTVFIETRAQAVSKGLVGKENELEAIGRIRKMVNLLLTRQRALPTTDFLTAFCGAFERTRVLARLIIDDYDALHLQLATRPPALTYIFVSGTSMLYPSNQFGFPSKPSYETYARRAMAIAVEPTQVLAFIGLAPPEEQAVLCLESAAQKMFMQLCTICINYVECYRGMALQRFKLDPFRLLPEILSRTQDPLQTLLARIQLALNNDSVATILESLFLLHQCGSEVGFPILPESIVEKRDPRSVTLGMLGSFLYRKIYSERMRINICQLALECLGRFVRDKKIPQETRYVVAAMRNFNVSFSYPPSTIPFREVVTVAMEPKFALSHLARAQIPLEEKVDDNVIRYIWEFVQPRPNVVQLSQYIEFLAPFLVYAIWKAGNFGNLAIDVASFTAAVTKARETLDGINSKISIPSKTTTTDCIVCKRTNSPTFLTCCGSVCCLSCLPNVVSVTQHGGDNPSLRLQCRICRGSPNNAQRVFALQMVGEGIPSLSALENEFTEIRAAREKASKASTQQLQLQNILQSGRLFLPLCAALLGPYLSRTTTASEFPSAYTTVLLDKPQSLKMAVERMVRSRREPVRILLYHNYSDVNESLIELLSPLEVKVRTFNADDSKLYRTSTDHLLIIANDLAQICGFNMEYLDAVVFYSPPRSIDMKKQIVCRGQRLGRQSKHKLIVLTLFYEREMASTTYQIPTVNDLPMWKNLQKLLPSSSAVTPTTSRGPLPTVEPSPKTPAPSLVPAPSPTVEPSPKSPPTSLTSEGTLPPIPVAKSEGEDPSMATSRVTRTPDSVRRPMETVSTNSTEAPSIPEVRTQSLPAVEDGEAPRGACDVSDGNRVVPRRKVRRVIAPKPGGETPVETKPL